MTRKSGIIGYAFKHKKSELFAGMDITSGGYLYTTTRVQEIKIFHDTNQIEAYKRMFPEYEICKIKISIEEIEE